MDGTYLRRNHCRIIQLRNWPANDCSDSGGGNPQIFRVSLSCPVQLVGSQMTQHLGNIELANQVSTIHWLCLTGAVAELTVVDDTLRWLNDDCLSLTTGRKPT